MGVGNRGGYYEGAGALRDMIQNHLLQLLSLVAMEPPNQMTSEAIRNEKNKLFQSLKPLSTQDVINNVIRASDRKELINSTKALDRALLWGNYVIPHWHINYYRLSYWNKFSKPKITPKYSLGFFTWWIAQKKLKVLNKKKG